MTNTRDGFQKRRYIYTKNNARGKSIIENTLRQTENRDKKNIESERIKELERLRIYIGEFNEENRQIDLRESISCRKKVHRYL